MPLKISEAILQLERIADPKWAFEWDRAGLQIGDPERLLENAMVSLDWSESLVEAASKAGCGLVVCHHPLIWKPLASLTTRGRAERIALRLAERGIAFYACHTQWDCAPGGINDTLAEVLGLSDVSAFGDGASAADVKLVVFCPNGSEERIIDAASQAGAGRIGAYSRCAFFSEGTGTYIGGEGSHPAIGKPGATERVEEVRVEMLVPSSLAERVEDAVRSVHPYEEPALEFVRLKEVKEMPIGRIGVLPNSMSLESLVELVDRSLHTSSWCWGPKQRSVSTVALVGGAGSGLWHHALKAGADVLVTGEVKQDEAVDAVEAGVSLIAAGHYATEQPGVRRLADVLSNAVPEVGWSVFEPVEGQSGRPFSN